MTARYIPLNGLLNRDESSTSSPRTASGWRLPKRWVSFLIVTFTLLTTIYLFLGNGPPISYTGSQQTNGSPSVPSISSGPSPSSSVSYLLGSEEDSTKLWFPPLHDEREFRPTVASYNAPLASSQRPRTPLFIAFTRNNAMLQQVVLSYIAAGWPREDIIVVDNAGTMDSNPRHLLTPKNPFYLDYDLFRNRYGVSILQTPTLLTFAQLQNFFLRVSMAHGWRYFFWSHMDVAVLSDEEAKPYKSFHARVLDVLSDLGVTALDTDMGTPRNGEKNWAIKYFTYDWLTLVNVEAWRKIGAWDTFIPYYATDCDAYSRIVLNGFTKDDVRTGRIFDLPEALQDPEAKFFPPTSSSSSSKAADDSAPEGEAPGSRRYHLLVAELEKLERRKPENQRNNWQAALGEGGKGEPWTYDPDGFQKMWWATAEKGRDMYRMKWGTSECRLDEHGVKLDDAWQT
ncbi:hypothetical protein AYO21_01170 [Fonsecaea monophora]|uniref:Uncharacterized protein n=1 Tax=Fonsecaea monophora TaxID=254056 RepID=A0A177FM76_9EURO|nr:hypothetical protein AYO21_01170 [Fonsecaea monophora]KAH0841596.1 hypothetical protein FOPE_06891 [Fonsecaea pedrosoi]OAG44680.1 hypothetical protein AYO21_01170 [Fonsecaea monophora]